MSTELTKAQWIEILSNPKLTRQIDLAIFQTLYSFEGHKAYASQVGIVLGFDGETPQSPINLEIGRYAKRIAKHYEIQFTERSQRKYKYWDLFFNGWDEGKYFVWELKPELIKSLEESQLTVEEISSAEELSVTEQVLLTEGQKKTISVNSFERNPKARQLCIDHWGNSCVVCDLNFATMYGELGEGFIQVHHMVPLSQIGKSYHVNPITDLRPVCPNCHSMLHKQSPPLKIEELKMLIDRKN